MGEQDLYEEYKIPPQIWGWVMLIAFAVIIMGFAMWAHHGIPDPPRYWDHGELPDTPAQSVYSTYEPSPIATKNRIISPLPEGQSLKEKVQELGTPGPPPPPGEFRQERQGG